MAYLRCIGASSLRRRVKRITEGDWLSGSRHLHATVRTPYVAQSLVAKRPGLERVGPGLLPRVAKILLDAAEGKTDSCSGAKGLNAAAIVELRKWAVKAHANETIQKTK